MPHKLRVLSGDEIIATFQKFGFTISFSKGSHVKLSRIMDNEKQTIVVPRHSYIAKGTLKSIYRKAVPYVGEEKLRPIFYTE